MVFRPRVKRREERTPGLERPIEINTCDGLSFPVLQAELAEQAMPTLSK